MSIIVPSDYPKIPLKDEIRWSILSLTHDEGIGYGDAIDQTFDAVIKPLFDNVEELILALGGYVSASVNDIPTVYQEELMKQCRELIQKLKPEKNEPPPAH